MTISMSNYRWFIMRFLLLLGLLTTYTIKADHYYGGYFTYKHLQGYTYELTLITYADNDKVNSDRDSVFFNWGDGAKTFIQRVNNFGNGDVIFPGVKKNIYKGIHTYPGEGNYQAFFQDIYRLYDVRNMESGKSGVTALYFSSLIPVHDTLVNCINNSPTPIFDPYIFAKTGDKVTTSFTFFDIDGDSVVYEMSDCKGLNNNSAPGYYVPNDVDFDPVTGRFTWDNPLAGVFCFAIEMKEYREGKQISWSSLDFPVFVDNNDFPKGVFSLVSGLNNNVLEVDLPGARQISIQYQNSSADSVFINIGSGIQYSDYYGVRDRMTAVGNVATDTVNIDYYGSDKQEGPHVFTFEAGSIFGSDTVFDYFSFPIYSKGDTLWDCEVESIEEIYEVAPIIPSFTIAPNLFQETVWINVGSAFERMDLEVYDARGRLVHVEKNISAGTIQLDLGHLRNGLYMVRFNRDGEATSVVKMVKY